MDGEIRKLFKETIWILSQAIFKMATFVDKLTAICPNLAVRVGENVGAPLMVRIDFANEVVKNPKQLLQIQEVYIARGLFAERTVTRDQFRSDGTLLPPVDGTKFNYPEGSLNPIRDLHDGTLLQQNKLVTSKYAWNEVAERFGNPYDDK